MAPDLLAVIFSRLDMDELLAVQLVCRAWRGASLHPQCWDSVHLELHGRFLDTFIKEEEEEKSDVLRLYERKRLNDMTWYIVHRSGERAKSVSLNSINSDQAVRVLAQRCPFVESLALEDCEGVTESALIDLARSCTKLRLFSLSGCHSAITAAFIGELGRSCPNLVGLKLSAVSISDEAAAAISASLPGLRYLNLSRTDVSKDGALGILGACADLECVDVRCCPALDAYEVALQDVKAGGRVKAVWCDVSVEEALETEWGWGYGF